jgi:hypothetical protein
LLIVSGALKVATVRQAYRSMTDGLLGRIKQSRLESASASG